ncbi:hypothetical protein J1N35_033482 [Gossypium stocksii]|uniref:Uncharacterized protein n=1 Tax=Gossypium stocksii TaxID=47602 RepID=A0A9D3ZPI4_9ROSI|nr:hypothetical protein J1N35_033482 [Gossypium stocksii]
MLGPSTILHDSIPTAFAAKATVCFQVIQMGLNLRLWLVKIGGDALSVVRKLQKGGLDRSEIGSYITDSKYLCVS